MSEINEQGNLLAQTVGGKKPDLSVTKVTIWSQKLDLDKLIGQKASGAVSLDTLLTESKRGRYFDEATLLAENEDDFRELLIRAAKQVGATVTKEWVEQQVIHERDHIEEKKRIENERDYKGKYFYGVQFARTQDGELIFRPVNVSAMITTEAGQIVDAKFNSEENHRIARAPKNYLSKTDLEE